LCHLVAASRGQFHRFDLTSSQPSFSRQIESTLKWLHLTISDLKQASAFSSSLTIFRDLLQQELDTLKELFIEIATICKFLFITQAI
jgi:hypothetical protein